MCIPHQSICQTQDSPLALSSQTNTTSRRKKSRPSPQRMIVQIRKLSESRPIDSSSSRRQKPYYSTIYHTILLPQARHQQFLPDYIIYTGSHIRHLGCPRDPSAFIFLNNIYTDRDAFKYTVDFYYLIQIVRNLIHRKKYLVIFTI